MVAVLRHTGVRIEELTELAHHSLIQYRLPDTGQLIPLLQITPSKTDAERLLVISPELADTILAERTRKKRPPILGSCVFCGLPAPQAIACHAHSDLIELDAGTSPYVTRREDT